MDKSCFGVAASSCDAQPHPLYVHQALCTVVYTVHSVTHCAPGTVYQTPGTLHCTPGTVHCGVHRLSVLCSQCTTYSVRTPGTVQLCAMSSAMRTLHCTHCTSCTELKSGTASKSTVYQSSTQCGTVCGINSTVSSVVQCVVQCAPGTVYQTPGTLHYTGHRTLLQSLVLHPKAQCNKVLLSVL